MNNNRNSNRRRGRNNRGQGGGNQGNRIDSRARGNAPQMLEKYKKLAHDASLNGDRVQTEYYLQFADHYFRVIADIKAQKEEQQQRGRRDDRDDEDGDDENYAEETSAHREPKRNTRRRDTREDDEVEHGTEGEGTSADEADEEANPFVRETKPRRTRRSTRTNGSADKDSAKDAENEAGGLDPASLPPAIGAEDKSSEEEPRPRRRTRRTREASGGDEALEVVSS